MNETRINRILCELSVTFPDLRIERIRVLGEGWDSVAVLVNEEIVFRMPKRDFTAWEMEKEVRVLQAIRPYVTAEIPRIEWVGRKEAGSTISVVGYRMLEGTPLAEMLVENVKEVYPKLSHFLRELHTIPNRVLLNSNLPWFRWTGDEARIRPDGWESGLRGFVDLIQQQVFPLLTPNVQKNVIDKMSAFMTNRQNFSFAPVLLHGDFAPDHVLIHHGSEKLSVIDFGDCGLGDPAYDVWLELAPYYADAIDEQFAVRQKFYRWLEPFHGVLYGRIVKDEMLVQDGLQRIEVTSK